MTIAGKIVKLRKAKGMTQSELGKELNITYQAVSKWERDESQPDFDTICKLAKIFGVPITYFESDDSDESADAAETEAVNKEETAVSDMVGVCTVCGRILREGENEGGDKLLCKACAEEKRKKQEAERKAAEKARAEADRKKAVALASEKARFAKRITWACVTAGLISAVLLAILIIGSVGEQTPADLAMSICVCIFTPIVVFMWVFQLFWDGVARTVTCWGLQVIKLPGIIFSADLDGLIFLIVMKIFLTVLSWLISFVLICATSLLGMLVGIVTFIPLVLKIHKRDIDIL